MLGQITNRLEKQAEKKTKSDWEKFTSSFAHLADRQREDTLRIRHEGHAARNEAGVVGKWEMLKNNDRLRDRVWEIDNWRIALEQGVVGVDGELKKLQEAKEALEQGIEVKVMDLDMVNEIMSVREQRRGNDYVEDEAQKELVKESHLIKDARTMLEKKAQEAWQQISNLQEIRHSIIRDLNEKVVGLEIDRYVLNLSEGSTENCFRPDPLRELKGMLIPQAWEEQSRFNKVRADNQVACSLKLRESMLLALDEAYNDIRSQREVTDFAMRKRLHELSKTMDNLQHQRQKILQEICKVEKEIRKLEEARQDKTNKMKLAETRLEHRTYRYGVELVKDEAQHGLTHELVQLRAIQNDLQAKMNDAKQALNMLRGFLQTLETEIENNSEAVGIEKMALDVRARVFAVEASPLTKVDRNIALAATIPTQEGENTKEPGLARLIR